VNIILIRAIAISLGALTLSLALGVQSSMAIEELKIYRGVLVLEGKIVPGDYDQLRNFLGNESNFAKITGGVFLASPGGYVTEAMKIGHLIRALRLSTDAPSGPPRGIAKFGEPLIQPRNLAFPKANYICASACFFMYVSGIYRNLNWAGRLGVHRPTQLESEAGTHVSDEARKSRSWFLHETVKNYLKNMDVPEKYVDLIFSTPPNGMRWITQDEFDGDLRGFIPEMTRWVGGKCDRHTNEVNSKSADLKTISPKFKNAKSSESKSILLFPREQSSATVKCWMEVKTELPGVAWHKVFFGR
jgi:hypothetical protein